VDYFLHVPLRSGPVRQLTPKLLADNARLHMLMRHFVPHYSCFVAPRRCRSQRAYLTAYLSDRVVPATDDAETPALAVEHSVKASRGKPTRRDRWPASPATRIAMIHHGRCGSQILGDLLDQHSRVGSPGLTSHRESIGSDKRTSRTYREL
jgi:hypothetical protein